MVRMTRLLRPGAAALAFAIALAGCSPPAAREPAVPLSAPTPPPMPSDPSPLPAPAARSARDNFFLSREEGRELHREARRRGMPPTGALLVVDVARQRVALVGKNGPVREFAVSTSKFGTGSAPGSNRTPLGWHRVAERFGAGSAPGAVFVSRRTTGRVVPPSQWRAPSPAEDLVLTRVLWLEGLEPGLNRGPGVDSHDRCIYLHGTNQEQLLGSPASHGCIRLSNADAIRLFDLLEGEEAFCLIR